MPTRRDNQVPEFKGYLQIELNETDISSILEASTKMTNVWKSVSEACQKRYKFSVTRDSDPLLYKATLMDLDITRSSAGWMLSGQGASVEQAIAALMYKHIGMTNEEWTPFLTHKRETNAIR
jgi:hypothetical protein